MQLSGRTKQRQQSTAFPFWLFGYKQISVKDGPGRKGYVCHGRQQGVRISARMYIHWHQAAVTGQGAC